MSTIEEVKIMAETLAILSSFSNYDLVKDLEYKIKLKIKKIEI